MINFDRQGEGTVVKRGKLNLPGGSTATFPLQYPDSPGPVNVYDPYLP